MRIEEEVVVETSPRAAFLFAGHPDHMPSWNPAVLESWVVGPMEEGATVVQVAQVVGQRFETVYTVSRYEPFRLVTFSSTSGPMRIEGTMGFEPRSPGTAIRWSIEGDCRGYLQVAEWLLRVIGGREMRTCLARLKGLLARGPVGATEALVSS